MQDSSQINYFGQRILQIIQPLVAGKESGANGDRRQMLANLAQSVADNFAADGCWLLQYPSPNVMRILASACSSHRTKGIEDRLSEYTPPIALKPTMWQMPLLPDYHVIVVNTCYQQQVNGCLMLATKGVEWYPETKLILQIAADYIATALVQEELQQQAQIAQIYPALHYHLTQAIVENQDIDRLFEIAVSDMVTALKLKRGLVLTLKSSDTSKQRHNILEQSNHRYLPEPAESEGDLNAPTSSQLVVSNARTPIQIVTIVDTRDDALHPLPSSFLLENSYFCQQALVAAPKPQIFEGVQKLGTPIDRQIFQDDLLPSIAMIPLMGSAIPDRSPAAALWGWLVLQHHEHRRWHPVELKLLQSQICQIALARIHKQALSQARTAVANRTSQVQTSLQIQAKLHDAGRKRMEKLRQANQLKDEFINTVSHELRTPLTSMLLAIEMLRQPSIDEDRRQQYLHILHEQCQREIKLVNDLLKLQQLESQEVELRPQPILLDRFISEQVNAISDRWLPSKGLEVIVNLPPTSPQIDTDADSLRQILEELLVNAGKFALPKSTVEVWVSATKTEVTLQIANLSKQIPSQDLPNLFEKFRRGTGTTQQAIAGTGLGLALVKSLVEHLQGNIEATSNPIDDTVAKTCFTIVIPTVLDGH
jgi:signal transduction histidine kinase